MRFAEQLGNCSEQYVFVQILRNRVFTPPEILLAQEVVLVLSIWALLDVDQASSVHVHKVICMVLIVDKVWQENPVLFGLLWQGEVKKVKKFRLLEQNNRTLMNRTRKRSQEASKDKPIAKELLCVETRKLNSFYARSFQESVSGQMEHID